MDTQDQKVGFDPRCIFQFIMHVVLTLKVLVATIDAQWDGMGDVG